MSASQTMSTPQKLPEQNGVSLTRNMIVFRNSYLPNIVSLQPARTDRVPRTCPDLSRSGVNELQPPSTNNSGLRQDHDLVIVSFSKAATSKNVKSKILNVRPFAYSKGLKERNSQAPQISKTENAISDATESGFSQLRRSTV